MARHELARLLAGTAAFVLLTGSAAGIAQATEGYFSLGYGVVQKGQGGAGIADAYDAMSATSNPAAAANVGQELSLGIEFFMPNRGYTADGTFFVPPGHVESGDDLFLNPNIAYNMPLDNGTVLNFAAFGNGGMNTDYPDGLPGCGSTYCGGPAGVDLAQMFLSVTWAGRSGGFSWGIAPTLAIQRFRATGLGAFSMISTDPASLTNNGYDYSNGLGLRLGAQYQVNDMVTLGLTGQTQFEMSAFDSYSGLFADEGKFNIPAYVGAGIAVKPDPAVTVLMDYQYIYYSQVGAVGNATDAGPLGAKGGAGFGWDDVGVLKLGVTWQQSDDMIWRAGYAHASNPVSEEDVTLNILAPGIVENHFTLGGTRKLSANDSLDFAIVYVPQTTISGPETTPMGPTPGTIELEMDQLSLAIGWSRKF